jgi:hypothetical protein
MYELEKVPFVQARWFTPVPRWRAIRHIVIHDMEYTERPDAAEIIAHDFATRPPESKASAHDCIDNNSIICCVRDWDVAYAAPGANSDGIQIEIAGFGRQTRAEWLDGYGKGALSLACDRVAQYCLRHDLPVKHLSNAELEADEKGIVGHYQVSQVYKKSNHTDPGPGFPWDAFLLATAVQVGSRKAAGGGGKPSPGERRYSRYFRRWITLVAYIDDNHWSFRVDGGPGILTAQAAWSAMPKEAVP